MNAVENAVLQLESDLRLKDEPITKEILTETIDRILKRTKRADNNFFGQMEIILKKMESGEILTGKEKKFSPGTIRSMRASKKCLHRFKPTMTLANINMAMYYAFIKWCQDQKYSTNLIGNRIKHWKSFCNKMGGSPIIGGKDFKIMAEDAFDVYATEEELKALHEAKLPELQSIARHWFIIGAYTGLRVSDLVMLNKKNLGEFITIANEKTDVTVSIPVHKYVKEIIKYYKGFPPPMRDTIINNNIKAAAKKAGIKGKVLHTITKGGKRVDTYQEKWEMFSTHTGRRSFITNMLRGGYSHAIIMKLAGITSYNTLKKYNKMTPEEAATTAKDFEFFK